MQLFAKLQSYTCTATYALTVLSRGLLPLLLLCCFLQDDIPNPVKVSLVVHHQALLRNKRCLLTYLKLRADRFVLAAYVSGIIVGSIVIMS